MLQDSSVSNFTLGPKRRVHKSPFKTQIFLKEHCERTYEISSHSIGIHHLKYITLWGGSFTVLSLPVQSNGKLAMGNNWIYEFRGSHEMIAVIRKIRVEPKVKLFRFKNGILRLWFGWSQNLPKYAYEYCFYLDLFGFIRGECVKHTCWVD